MVFMKDLHGGGVGGVSDHVPSVAFCVLRGLPHPEHFYEQAACGVQSPLVLPELLLGQLLVMYKM